MNIAFIFSQPRSGSTLLQRILASHPRIHSVSETWLLLPQICALQPRRILADYNHTIAQLALSDFIKELKRGRDDYNACLRDFFYNLYSRVLNEKDDIAYILEKTPRYYLIIPEIANIFPDAKFIFLFRNPLSVMSSIINTWHSGRLSFGMHYMDIFEAPKLLVEGFEKLGSRAIAVNFEKLIRTPHDVIQRILAYLELDHDSGVIDRYKHTSFRRMQPSENKYNSLDETRISDWERTLNTKFRARFARRYVERLGRSTFDKMGIDFDSLMNKIKILERSSPYKKGIRDRATLVADAFLMSIEWPFIRRRVKQRLTERFFQQFYY